VIVLGMFTAPPEPVYSAMVIVPLLVVYCHWACADGGKIKSSSGANFTAQAALDDATAQSEYLMFLALLGSPSADRWLLIVHLRSLPDALHYG
jgi:hypothetical protein